MTVLECTPFYLLLPAPLWPMSTSLSPSTVVTTNISVKDCPDSGWKKSEGSWSGGLLFRVLV